MKRRITLLLLAACLVIGLLAGCGGAEKTYRTAEDFQQAKIGVLTGAVFDTVAREEFPEAERVYGVNISDLVLSLEQGKIHGILFDEAYFAPLCWSGEELAALKMDLPATQYAMLLPKGAENSELKVQLDRFIRESRENGLMEQLEERWLSDSEPDYSYDLSRLSGENGTLRVAATLECRPFTYLKDQVCSGLDIELLIAFAEAYGYAIELDTLTFEALIPSLEAGKYDVAVSGVTITEERTESATFTIPYLESPAVMVVRAGEAGEGQWETLADLEHARLGILTGSSQDPVARERFPEAERHYYSMIADLMLSLENGKVDGVLMDDPYYYSALWEGSGIRRLEETVDRTKCAAVFPQGEENRALKEEYNAFIRRCREDGTLTELRAKWLGENEPDVSEIGYDQLTGEKGTLLVAVSVDTKPVSYFSGEYFAGYEVELLTKFAREHGYKLEFRSVTFESILPGILANKYDMALGGFTITEERAQSVEFGESHLDVEICMVVAAGKEQPGFWDNLRDGFEKTFIRESRWKMFVEGMGVTVLISVCAAVCGTLLGFGLYLLTRCRKKGIAAVARGVGRVYSRIVAGTPVVVILMILFYIVFGQARDISGVLVAVVGFSFTFGAFVYDHMSLSVANVPKGQTEAAYALGYSYHRTFLRIVLPQAMTVFLPTYCGELVSLVHATAVVGYIAVSDLTKMSDIIRSNTYEAFFPLLSTALIYFLLTWLLSGLLGLVMRRFEPKRRSPDTVLKGVKTQ